MLRVPALDLLLGGQPENVPALARLEPQMPINQSHELAGAAYQKAGASVEFVVVHGAGHGGAAFYDAGRLAMVKRFLRRYF